MRERFFRNAGWPFAVAFAWLWTWKHLSVEWDTNPQYQYGFAVPLLFLYAARQRWRGPMQPSQSCGTLFPLIAAWMALFLGELLRWQDPIWRFTGGLLVLGSTLLTAVWFFRRGGWPLLRRESFALSFAWLALPWPVPIELVLTQNLLHWVTGITVTAANILGIAALQRGSIIELANGYIGMANACSGVESFQSSLMASLFLGELFHLGTGRRCGLVAGGWFIAFFGNVSRVFCLLLVVHTKGQEALTAWHDLFGGLATAFTFLAIFGLAVWMSGRRPVEVVPFEPVASPVFLPAKREGWTLCFALAAIPLLAFAWFNPLFSQAPPSPVSPRWQLSIHQLPPGWSAERRDSSPQQRASLQFSQWDCILVRTPEGQTAKIIHLFWEPGKSMPAMAYSHTPALCMSSLGWNQVAQPQGALLKVEGEQIPCVRYSLEQEESNETVYQCLLIGGEIQALFIGSTQVGDRRERLSMLWKEPRRQIGEELLIYMPAVSGGGSQDEAAQKLLKVVLRTLDTK